MDSDRGNIVNFASFRKTQRDAQKRAEKKHESDRAAANRVKFGRTGADKKRAKIEEERHRRELEGKRLPADRENEADDEGGA